MTCGELIAILQERPASEPCRLALGRGRIVGPLRVAQVYVQPTDAAGYEIVHTDQGEQGTLVSVLVESPRIEPSY